MNKTVFLKERKISEINVLRKEISNFGKNTEEIVRFFFNKLDSEWEFYIKPHLNGLNPDMIMLKKTTGIIVVRFDSESSSAMKAEEHLELTQAQIRTVYCPSCINFQDPKQLNFRESLFLPVITSCIISNNLNEIELKKKYKKFADKSATAKAYFPLISKECMSRKDIKEIIPMLKHDGKSKKMNQEIFDELRFWLMSYESIFKENLFAASSIAPLVLDKTQKALTLERTASGYRKIKGPAGSGKTNILAGRALNCSLENKSVFFVTQNRSLVPYLMECVFRAIKNDIDLFTKIQNRGNISYLHFYAFASRINYQLLDQLGLGVRISGLLNKATFESTATELLDNIRKAKSEYPSLIEEFKYDVILVDEFQDWQKLEWLIVKEFLKENGEMVAAGDATQDIYSTGAKTNFDEPHALKGYGLPSRWRELNASYRLPYDYVPLMEEFIKEFLPHKGVMIPENRTRDAFTDTYVEWIMVKDNEASIDACVDAIKEFKAKDNLSNLLFLADSNPSGYIVLSELIKRNLINENELTHTYPYFGPTKALVEVHDFRKKKKTFWEPIYKSKRKGALRPEEEFQESFHSEEMRIRNRSGFFIQRNKLKASNIQNFKGLEAKNIIFQINPPDENQSHEEYFTEIYTGLTRLASVADLDASTGQFISGIKVICSEVMFRDYSKTWQEVKSSSHLPDF